MQPANSNPVTCSTKRAVVLWTGGKDCNLALWEAKRAGYQIAALVTFATNRYKFKAHPVPILIAQAKALSIPHLSIEINEPYKESYQKALAELKRSLQIDTVITGDIAEVDGYHNWITECSKPAKLNVWLPLWNLNRFQVLNNVIDFGFKTIFSCVKKPWFNRSWLGRELNRETLLELEKIRETSGLDICGEQGEYHTFVLDSPLFRKTIKVESFLEKKMARLCTWK
jgi:uncharacterized protein (TIGR00290 family)